MGAARAEHIIDERARAVDDLGRAAEAGRHVDHAEQLDHALDAIEPAAQRLHRAQAVGGAIARGLLRLFERDIPADKPFYIRPVPRGHLPRRIDQVAELHSVVEEPFFDRFKRSDLEAERARIAAAGYQPKDIKTMTHDGQPFGKFFFIEDPDGYKIEVLQRGGRFQ